MDICELSNITNHCIILVVSSGFIIISDLEVIPSGIITKSGLNFFAYFVLIPSGYLYEHPKLDLSEAMSGPDDFFKQYFLLKVTIKIP